jgi:1A family penicillin-binding protein
MNKFSFKKFFILLISLFFLITGSLFVWASTVRLPDLSNFQARKIANSSKITDRTGEVVLYDIQQSIRRSEIPFEEMGENIKNAVIAIEDADFFSHKGIRLKSIARATYANITRGSFVQGGSTITQQIIKNALLNRDKTVTRKFKEWILAIRIERIFTKEEILTIYLNDAPFGGTIYGVEEAAQVFFSVHSKDLSIAQSAYLAAMIPAPTYYSPMGKNKDKLINRKNLVLEKMYEHGYITAEEKEAARVENVVFNTNITNSIKAPHFVFYILDYLQRNYGEDVLERGGYTIKTTINYELQKKVEDITKEESFKNMKSYNASNAAVVILDSKTGQILSMVGSRDYFDKDIDGAFNVTTARRQPGSSFKTIIYAAALEKGFTPQTILFDTPTEFSTNCSPIVVRSTSKPEGCYQPDNFDNEFKGPLSLKSSLALSRNVPSVKLLYMVGLKNALEYAKKLGITSLQNESRYGLSLVLGGGEVSLLELTSAYSVFSNQGVRNTPIGIIEIKDNRGKIIESFRENSQEVVPRNVALQITDILSDNEARTPTFGPNSQLNIPGTAAKTGTTNDNRDAWVLGFSPDITVGVWSGNNNNLSMRSGGIAISGPLWNRVMKEVLLIYPSNGFETPLPEEDFASLKPILRGKWIGGESVYVDKVTGLRATENTPVELREERFIQSVQDTLRWIDKDNVRGPIPTNPYNDPQFRLWNPSVEFWWEKNKHLYGSQDYIPDEYETVHSENNGSWLIVEGISNTISINEPLTLSFSTRNQTTLTSIEIFANNKLLASLSSPKKIVFVPYNFSLAPGSYTLRFVGYNTQSHQSTYSTAITITQ